MHVNTEWEKSGQPRLSERILVPSSQTSLGFGLGECGWETGAVSQGLGCRLVCPLWLLSWGGRTPALWLRGVLGGET